MTMENTLQLILAKLESMEKDIKETKGELKEFRKEAREFYGVATEEFDKIKKDTETIKEQTESHGVNIEYLAGITGVHEMILKRKKN